MADAPLDDAKRKDLKKLIDSRKNELASKKKALEDLQLKFSSKSKADVVPTSTQISNLLGRVTESINNVSVSETDRPNVDRLLQDKNIRKPQPLSARKYKGRLTKTPRTVDVNILPSGIDSYEKSCQVYIPSAPEETSVEAVPHTGEKSERRQSHLLTNDELKGLGKQGLGPKEILKPKKGEKEHAADESEETPPPPPLTEEEKIEILKTINFKEFFSHTTRLVERSLGQAEMFDVFVDYSGTATGEGDDTGDAERVKKHFQYTDEKWSKGRPITDIRTSPKFNELFLCSYGQKAEASVRDPDGCVLVWNVTMAQRPEYIFTCQSQVCTALFDKFQPHIVVGGTYTGSVLLWDTRARRLPIQRTPLSSKGHSHPIYSLEMVGTQHAHNLVTVDVDGRLCVWSLSMLVHPTESLDFKRGNRDLSCLCITFAEGETNVLYGGAEDGSVFQSHIHGSKTGVTEVYEAHQGPVSSVHFHGCIENQPIDFSDLLLSTSFDWSIKLWNPRNQNQPIQSFDISEDYISDCKWSPTHPAVFASADGEGYLDLWDLSKDLEVPIVRTHIPDSASNRLCWSSDGKRLLTGDTEGTAVVWGVSQEFSAPKPEDWTKMEEKIEELKTTDEKPSHAAT